MALVLMLSLSPFLHAHLGDSTVTGFHLDLPAGPPQGEAVPSGGSAAHAVASVGALHHESPAFGVAGAYPAQSRDWQAADIGSFFMLVLFLASLLPCQAMDRVRARAQPAKFRACYRPGCPPPAMAPPHASH